MAWECKACHRSIQLDPDPRGCDDEPICWHCLYEHREALLAVCEEALECFRFEVEETGPVKDRLIAAIAAAKGEQ